MMRMATFTVNACFIRAVKVQVVNIPDGVYCLDATLAQQKVTVHFVYFPDATFGEKQ